MSAMTERLADHYPGLACKLNAGKMVGLRIGDVLLMTSQQTAVLGYGKDGLAYVKWLAGDRNLNKYTRIRAQWALAEARKLGWLETTYTPGHWQWVCGAETESVVPR